MIKRLVVLGVLALVSRAALYTSVAAVPFTPSRTPWGDPDLQGTYTNKTSWALRSSGRESSKDGASRI